MTKRIGLVAVTVAVSAVWVMVAWASPAVGVTPLLLARGTYDAFRLKTHPQSPVDIDIKSKRPLDIVVREHTYEVGSSTGWHTHPGPVFITVVEGEVTFYEYDDPTCTARVVRAGEGYVDTGHGHIGLNESGAPARDVTVVFAPEGGGFRGELPAPSPHCPF